MAKMSRREKRAARAAEKERHSRFEKGSILDAIRPRERYVFHSDYFEIDGSVACVLAFAHNEAGVDGFPPFWGINKIPVHLPDDVVTINFDSVSRMSESWINAHQSRAEAIAETDMNEQGRNGTISTQGKASSRMADITQIGRELNNGASYLRMQSRILVKAPDLETLDQAVEKIERRYSEKFSTIAPMAYMGDQRHELATLLDRNEAIRGKGMYATSPELAGSYNLVTHGLEDARGEYIGAMTGDINNSSVIFDVDAYRHHVVVGSEGINVTRGGAHVSDMWGSKVGQACLMNGGKVVHILLDECRMDRLGPAFADITTTLDMNHGDINMFEMFGKVEDELAIFPSQMQKLVLMAEQTYATNDADRAIIRGSLEEVATKFYVDKRMWHENAGDNRQRLRVVGIPHREVPRLQEFVTYLDMEHKALIAKGGRDTERTHAMGVLRMAFRNLLSNNGDLFNQFTSDSIDRITRARRVVYDFSDLMRRGTGIAMAQLVNVIDLAVSQCGRNDVVVIHGAQLVDPGVRDYVSEQFRKLYRRGGRVAFMYSSVRSMVDDVAFNHFDSADWTIVGNMTDNLARDYQRALGQEVPKTLTDLVTDKSDNVMYIRRGYDNVVFHLDLQLDPLDLGRGRRRR